MLPYAEKKVFTQQATPRSVLRGCKAVVPILEKKQLCFRRRFLTITLDIPRTFYFESCAHCKNRRRLLPVGSLNLLVAYFTCVGKRRGKGSVTSIPCSWPCATLKAKRMSIRCKHYVASRMNEGVNGKRFDIHDIHVFEAKVFPLCVWIRACTFSFGSASNTSTSNWS